MHSHVIHLSLKLWRTNGTSAAQVYDVEPGAGDSEPISLVASEQWVFFIANGEPWVTNGSDTFMIEDIGYGDKEGLTSSFIAEIENTFIYQGSGIYGTEMYVFPCEGWEIQQIPCDGGGGYVIPGYSCSNPCSSDNATSTSAATESQTATTTSFVTYTEASTTQVTGKQRSSLEISSQVDLVAVVVGIIVAILGVMLLVVLLLLFLWKTRQKKSENSSQSLELNITPQSPSNNSHTQYVSIISGESNQHSKHSSYSNTTKWTIRYEDLILQKGKV